MSGYTTDPVALAAADADLSAHATGVRQAVDGLGGEVRALLAGGWRGGAATAFEQAWEDWALAAGRLADVLAELAATIGSAGAGYAGVEGAVRTAIAGTAL